MVFQSNFIANALSKVDVITKTKIKAEVYRAMNQRYAEGKVLVDASTLIISGEK